jgi:hypothetical protein
MQSKLTFISLSIGALLMLSFVAITTTNAYAQQQYQSPTNGFAVTLPQGFVIQDIDQRALSDEMRVAQAIQNFELIANVCLEQDSTPSYGGSVECNSPDGASNASLTQGADVRVFRFSNLQNRPEIDAAITSQGKQITPNDVLTMHLKLQEGISSVANTPGSEISFEVENQTAANIFASSGSNSLISQLAPKQSIPAVFAEVTATVENEITGTNHQTKQFGLYLVSPDQTTGYVLLSPRWNPATTPDVPQPIMDIMKSFEVPTD